MFGDRLQFVYEMYVGKIHSYPTPLYSLDLDAVVAPPPVAAAIVGVVHDAVVVVVQAQLRLGRLQGEARQGQEGRHPREYLVLQLCSRNLLMLNLTVHAHYPT